MFYVCLCLMNDRADGGAEGGNEQTSSVMPNNNLSLILSFKQKNK